MAHKRRVLLSWSSGKDSAWALRTLRQDETVDVVGLLTSFNVQADRVAMHAVRRQLVSRQAEAAQLPLHTADLPWPCSNSDYEEIIAATLDSMKDEFDTIAFGDLFLEDIRTYRETQLSKLGVTPEFPLWGKDTAALANEMIAGGIEAVLTCVDPKQCPAQFAGHRFDAALLRALPPSVDRCGENGEFHTFVHASPDFWTPIDVRVGDVIERDGFVFADVVPHDALSGNR